MATTLLPLAPLLAPLLLPNSGAETARVPQALAAQVSATEQDNNLGGSFGVSIGTTIVTATRGQTSGFDAPYSAAVVDSTELERRSYRTVPQALRNISSVMVQETAYGQGSPFIRGFTGFRNLFLIDGIRLNNSVFRDGPNQYWNTVDPWSLERLEVVKGPTSVLYGSDAIGGTVNAITRNPYTYGSGFQVGGQLSYRVASAERSHIGRGEVGTSWGSETGILLGITGKTFGDVIGGDEVGTQFGTAYDEVDVDLKIEHFLSPTKRLVAAYQRVRQDDVPRTHSTVDGINWEGLTNGSDLRRELDQRRDLAYVQLHEQEDEDVGYSLSLSYHRQEEAQDRIRSTLVREITGLEVGTIGFFANARSLTSIGRLTYGLELYHDDVDSFSSTNPIQGPVGDDSTYDVAGLFLQDEFDASDKLRFTLGARWNYAAADSDRVRDPVTTGVTSIDESWNALVGSARFLYAATETVHMFGGVSQGFRAPNLSDLTRFSSARSNEFEIPSTDLDPEHFISFEVGVKMQGERSSAQVSTYYTDIRDAIVRFPTGNVNGSGEFEITKDNVGDGYVFGIELDGTHRFAREWSVFGNATWMDGEVDTFPTSAPVIVAEDLDRVMPLTLVGGVGWENTDRTRWAELMARFADDADRLSTRDQNDTSRIPPGGTPSYLVFHVRGGAQLLEGLRATAAVENLFDEDYRIHGSGLNMPGRNFVLGLTASF